MKNRKRRGIVEAVWWQGNNDEAVKTFAGDMCEITRSESPLIPPDLVIHTLEGKQHALVGDFIIKGDHGEFYPCNPDVFWKIYKELSE